MAQAEGKADGQEQTQARTATSCLPEEDARMHFLPSTPMTESHLWKSPKGKEGLSIFDDGSIISMANLLSCFAYVELAA